MSVLVSAVAADILARDAAVARVTPPVGTPATPVVVDASARGLVRVKIREGRALAFSFSFTAVARVVRVARRVCVAEMKIRW
jgi:hypothetical protein